MTVEFKVLGSLEVVVDGEIVSINAPKQRAVLAVLLLHADQPVRTPRLIKHLWGAAAPKNAYNAVQTHVTRLRRALGPSDLIRTVEGGYLIRTDRVDLQRFRDLVARARTASDEDALPLLRQATALWRGPLLPDLRIRSEQEEELNKIESELLNATENKVDLELRARHHAEVVAELRALTTSYPLRESFWNKLMLALFRSGQQAEALDAFRNVTKVLNAELGVTPGRELRQLHQEILSGEAERQGEVRETTVPIPRQLPAGIGNFTGRREAVDGLLSTLGSDADGCPVVVVSGSPGAGKTTLAVHVAQRLCSIFSDGQLHINLHGYSSSEPPTSEQVLSRFLRALGASSEEIPARLEEQHKELLVRLSGRRVLFLLDNAATAEKVRSVLPLAKGCGVLVTSRVKLTGITQGTPETCLSIGVLEEFEAIELLRSILREKSACCDSEDVLELVELCGRLPLALCIAGANIAAEGVGVAEYVRRLRDGDRLSMLAIDGDEQARLAATFMLSYSSLEAELQSALRLLSIVPGRDFCADAASTCLDSRTRVVVPLLDRLVSANLLEAPYPGRYQFHDLLKLFAERCLRSDSLIHERLEAERRIYGFYFLGVNGATKMVSPEKELDTLPRAFSLLPEVTFSSVEEASGWVTKELENIVAIVESAEPAGYSEVCWLIPNVLRGYLYEKHRTVEWLQLASAGLRAARHNRDRDAEGAMLHGMGTAFWADNRIDEAIEHLDAAVETRREIGDEDGLKSSLMNLAIVLWGVGSISRSVVLMEQAATLFGEGDPIPGRAPVLVNLAMIYASSGRLREAVEIYGEALDICRRFNISWGEANVLANLGNACWEVGDMVRARELAKMAAVACAKVDLGVQQPLCVLAEIDIDLGFFEEAEESLRAGIIECRKAGDRKIEHEYLWAFGHLWQRMGKLDEALVWYTDALDLARTLESRATESRALLDMATVHAELGRPSSGLRLARQAMRVSTEGGFRATQGSALTAAAVCCFVAGRAGSAAAFGRRALEVHRETGHRPGEARTLRVIGQALWMAGERAGALEHWERAVEMFAEMGMPEADGVRELLGQAR
ncbi:tetratricopeptide repeat protein [Allokutzneria sp. A3M-2-11 16]|uniref:AfsR/SARP family transcriptional regulator n=1 Tax=Allokutzneria sp. A3M-2-11 16 TaxID=2962043 RepID=UPI0020B7F3DA|nr:BTAD domain-containing putative transcriptional regulator [Allokutzneria sp. A3M-2-11 16]MCP3800093.1 tetratricopeptide repeat protein [Allokutzneria sp. A3M-2-11 16]